MLKRQGDLLFELVTEWPGPNGPTQKVTDGVIERGETTGHAHRVAGGELLRAQRGGALAVAAVGGTEVRHEEHDALQLEPGVWLVHRQQEYVSKDETAYVYD